MHSKQATLFSSWGGKQPLRDGNARQTYKGKAPTRAKAKNPSHRPATAALKDDKPAESGTMVDLTEYDDFGFKNVEDLDKFFEDDVSEEMKVGGNDPETGHNTSILEDIPGFDPEAGQEWIYPTNYPIRDYQFNIVQKCLFKNTLVCLPTGLGKTFIAAVVMFNFYRWYPSGKIIFMAPTKPLVTQQIEACHNIMGIPQTHLAEMTGNLPPRERAAQWMSKRVFFLTPQVMQNDINKGACPADVVRCVVFDEAHKALGNYSYCQVVKELSGRGVIFRILALSATPGNDLKAVQQVVTNLRLSHIELRSDESVDIQPYTHQRKVELHIVPLEGEILSVKNAFLEVLSAVIGRLFKYGVVYSSNPERLSKFGLLQAREGFRQGPPQNNIHPGTIEGDFATGISLFHAFDLLLLHGLRPFHHYLSHTFSSGSYPRAQREIDRHHDLCHLLTDLRKKLSSATKWRGNSSVGRSPRSSHYTSPSQSTTPNVFYGHPKLKRLEEVVLKHFRQWDGAQSSDGTAKNETRVMIFSQYRESVQEIADLLSSHAPLIRVMSFVGHGTTGKSTSKGLTQKEQTEVVRKFREGGYNTLVATCVGEEGLDIGEVDLIVCFDAHKSPVRLVQRMGRTGRKRSGKIIVIVAQGKEEQTYRKSQSNKNSIHKAIQQNSRSLHFFPHAPRMIPRHISPQCLKMCMDVEEFKVKEKGQRSKGRSRQPRLSLGPPPLARASKKGCLSHEELEEWSRNFSLPDRELKACERAVGDCYKPHPLLSLTHLKSQKNHKTKIGNRVDPNSSSTLLNSSVVNKFSLNLSKWVRWQTGQSNFKMVGSSTKGKKFQSLLEFLDLMYSSEGLGESYDAEMAAFLHQDDIITTTAGAASIGRVESEKNTVGRRERKKRRRRRLASESSDDCDFVEEVKSAKIETSSSKHHPIIVIDDPVVHETTPPIPDNMEISCLHSDRSLFTDSQHAIPKPPSCDSLDWLDNIEPSQISTPLPSSSSTTSLLRHPPPPSPSSSRREFQFAYPRTPPSSRKGKTLFVTPLTTPQPPPMNSPLDKHQQRVLMSGGVKSSEGDQQSSHDNMESIDLFNDLSSAVLFEDFSDVNISTPAEDGERREAAGPTENGAAESLNENPKEEEEEEDDELITSIPESDGGEEEEEEEDEGLRPHYHNSELETSEDDSLIRVCGQQRRKFARPDFLLTQAPPTTPPTSSQHSSQSEGVDCSSDEDDGDFLEPLSRRLRKKRGLVCEEERRKESDGVSRNVGWVEPEELLDREAELSGEGGESQENIEEEDERGGREDEYDIEDSFINDNSFLTQVTPSQVPERMRRRKPGPVNMADVYRQSLMSPDTLFAGREKRMDGYKMVLSERHKVLRHYMDKAAGGGRGGGGGGGKRLFHGEDGGREEREEVSSEESEAEEVRVQYGEEDREEMDDSQSIGEPWDWTAEEEEEEGEETRDDSSRSRNKDEQDIVSPNLLASIDLQQTPSCYKLVVDGWFNDDDDGGSCWSSEEFPVTSTDTEFYL